MNKVFMNRILRFQRAVSAMPRLSSGVCLGAILLAGAVAPARANTVGICDSVGAFGGADVSSASYSTAASTGCAPGFFSTLVPGGSVNPTSLAAGLTTATLTVDQTMPFGGTAISTATASLDQGVLRVYADTQGGTGSCGGSCVATDGRSTPEALFDDILHFNITDAAPSAIVTLFAHLDGSIQNQGVPTFSYSLLDQFSLGGGSGCYESSGGTVAPFLGPCTTGNFGFLTSSFTNQTASGFDFKGTFSVTNGESSVLFAALQADCQNGALCDFGNTASFSLGLPSDVTFTSDSGVLFTQPISGVPEPSADALLLTAMLGIGLTARRRLSGK